MKSTMMNIRFFHSRPLRLAILPLFLVACLFLKPAIAEKVVVPLGKAVTIKAEGVKKIMAIKEGVVEVLNVAEDEIILSGIGSPGTTQLIVWDNTGRHIFDVETYSEVDLLQRKFNTILGDNNLALDMFPDVVYIRGNVNSTDKVTKAIEITSKLVVDRPVVSMISVKPSMSLEGIISDAIKIPTVRVTVIAADVLNPPSGLASGSAFGPVPAVGPNAVKPRIILEGTVKDQNEYMRMMAIVRSIVDENINITDKDSKVQNLVTIEKPIQVVFQAYILQVNKDFTKEMGVKWGGTTALGGDPNTGVLNFTENVSTAFRGDQALPGAPVDSWPNPFKFNNINRFNIVAAQVKAWETKGKAKVLSNPKLMVYANASPQKLSQAGWKDEVTGGDGNTADSIAYVKVGESKQIPGEPDATGRTGNKEVAADLSLAIRDLFVSDPDKMKFTVFANQSEFTGTGGDKQTRTIMTTVRINNGETIVLGGLIKESKAKTTVGLPVLSKLPYLGKIFQSDQTITSTNELVILLTPEIVNQEPNLAKNVKFETVPVPRRSEHLEELHNLFQQIKSSHFPETGK
ncbi:MAG: pilus assembly protein N-terminal domain-containing protein [Candidatus Riflebacteria bacterium]|nr:pilus assembly protein N-terminal domain-containing protein [Candidatus Riflebacteria bacterium]